MSNLKESTSELFVFKHPFLFLFLFIFCPLVFVVLKFLKGQEMET